MERLRITELSATLVRISCEGGRVADRRNYRTYSVVECTKEDIHYFYAV